ncbi:DUF4845 domain-containing protein [Coralloluteibacterium thermophilus]|uniref:DUF4845 domain-containing protein n=1 Tax=Coralloluteibacterium thermophilum TaxID=2707049 RepID=A0ABV9NMX4_9GAMM
MASRQRGITLLGFLIVLAVVGFFAYVAMRLFPVYSEYYSVVSAMKGVANEPGVASMEPNRVRDLLNRRFDISYVDSVKPNNIKITRSGQGYTLNVKYEVRRPLIYNIDVVASFDRTVDLMRQGEID